MPHAVVLGGYGLIGAACLSALAEAGFTVTGVGRSARAAAQGDPRARWVVRDLTRLSPEDWRGLLAGATVVVNAAGALQDGAGDDLQAIHVGLVASLIEAARDLPLRIIQVSAAGAAPTASTRFFRSKAEGDALLARTGRDWVILRPTLVLGRETWGGSALLRAAAALPGVLPTVLPQARIQTVALEDVAAAVVQAATGEIPPGTIADLTEPGSQSFPELTLAIRNWLGLPAPLWRPSVPGWGLRVLGLGADALGYLGWRSPLRSTALTALAEGIEGDPGPWAQAGGRACRGLQTTLAARPATRADRLAARAYLALPLAIATLAVFWTLSGLIALADPGPATDILTSRGMGAGPAAVLVRGGAVADILLGLLILWRRRAGQAALGMVLLSLAYPAGSLVTAPDLWSDPLGPMLKVLPGMVLALWVWLFIEDR